MPPSIATEAGTLYRAEVLNSHVGTAMHLEASKAKRLASLRRDELVVQSPMIAAISESNKALASHVGRLMHHVYLDGMRLTLFVLGKRY